MRALMKLKRKRSGWIAVGFGADRIDVVQVQRMMGDRPRVVRLESYARGADDAAALAALGTRKQLAQFACTTLLAPGSYQMLQVEPPDVPGEELRDAVRWRLKDTLEFPVENATVDIARLPVEQLGGRPAPLLAVAGNNAVIGPRMKAFDHAKLELGAIDVPEMAQRNLAALLEDPNRGLAMLTIDETGGLLTFTFKGELCVGRRIDVNSVQFAGADESRRTQLLERIGLELQRSLDNFERQYTMISVSKIVLGPCPFAPGLLDYLKDYVYLPLHQLDLTELLDCSATPELRQPALQAERLSIIGAALRDDQPGGAA